MTAVEMKESIQRVFKTGLTHGVSAFAYIKTEADPVMKKFLMTDELRNNLSELLDAIVERRFLSEEAELDSADNIADNRKILYEVIQNSDYSPFAFLSDFRSVSGQYTEADQDALVGFFFRANINEDSIWLYQQVYQARLIKRSRSLYAALLQNHTYEPLSHDVLKIEDRIDIVIIGDSIITDNISLLQNTFGFEKYVRSEASETIQLIDSMDLVSGIEILQGLSKKEKLTNAKKLMKAKKSPVLQMNRTELITAIQRHPRYKDKFVIETEHIVLRTQKDAREFMKMLNDDIVRSELTNQEYDSSAKTMLAPVS